MIDTHSHIYHKEFDADLDAVIERAKAAGVSHVLLPNIDLDSVERMHKLDELYPGYCLPMMGLHPCDVDAGWKQELDTLGDMI
jgi:TatD DNase family protein